MSKKDYEAIAQQFRHTRPMFGDIADKLGEAWTIAQQAQWRADVVAIADVLERDNPLFDCRRFYSACGFEV